MKVFITALAVTLALPAAALARVDTGAAQDLRAPDQQAPIVRPSGLTPRGTDVAAPDQQAPRPLPRATVVRVPSAAPGFDWADAGVGAGGAVLLVTVSFGAAVLVRRRREPSAIAS